MEVKFWKLTNEGTPFSVGSLVFEDGKISPKGKDVQSLQEILQTPVRDARGRVWKSSENPEEFMKNLPKMYKGSYFWASMAETNTGAKSLPYSIKSKEGFIPYTGDRGGVGCLNTMTGKVSYGDPSACGLDADPKKKKEEKPKPSGYQYPKPKEEKPVGKPEEFVTVLRNEADKSPQQGPNPVDYVLANGRKFEGSALPATFNQGDSNCFVNATRLLLTEPTWNYVEGFVKEGNQPPRLHAWAVDENNTVMDNTIENPKGAMYIGVVYPRDRYLQYVNERGYYGVLGGRKEDAAEVLKNGGIH